MDVNFEYYKIFYYVAKYNNFTRAARVLGNSQPNVTRAMNCLEQQLHCTLLVRTNRGVHSDAGRGKAVYACSCGHGAAFDGRGGAGRIVRDCPMGVLRSEPVRPR